MTIGRDRCNPIADTFHGTGAGAFRIQDVGAACMYAQVLRGVGDIAPGAICEVDTAVAVPALRDGPTAAQLAEVGVRRSPPGAAPPAPPRGIHLRRSSSGIRSPAADRLRIMDSGDDSTTTASSDRIAAPRSSLPLPGRTDDSSATFERCLSELIDLLGAERPALMVDSGGAWLQWQHQARGVIAQAVRTTPVRQEWFEPLVRAAVHDPDPSFNRQLVEPALAAFGRRRVQSRLLDYLRTGTDPQRAGAARAWYWTQVPLTYLGRSRTPTPESKAEYDAHADLRRQWRDTALEVFLATEDLDVRRCILPGLDLRAEHYPKELRSMVTQAIHLARTHADEYLRHRVEHQI